MPKAAFRPIRATRRLLAIFAITILTPGLILGFFGVRALVQEGRPEQQVRQLLDGAAEAAGRRLETNLREWQEAADQLAKAGSTNPTLWPERVRLAIAQPGVGVVLFGSGAKVQAFPTEQLSYELTPVETIETAEDPEAEELRGKPLEQVIEFYRHKLVDAEPADRARLLHRLARTFKNAGRTAEALQTFKLLERALPVQPKKALQLDLEAMYQIASLQREPARATDALRLYRGLVEGRWRLDSPRYSFYSEEVRQWLPQNDEEKRLVAQEQQKLALTHAVERFLAAPRQGLFEDETLALAFWHREPLTAILLSEPFVRATILPLPDSSNLRFLGVLPDGRRVTSSTGHNVGQEFLGTYTVASAELPLEIQSWTEDPSSLALSARRRLNFNVAVLAAVFGLLAFGGFLIVRTLKTELAVAQMKSDFVSTVSHEFRSPLAGINQLGEMLRDGRVPDEKRRQEYYAMIVGETGRLRRLVENILDFSRMEDGRKQYRFEPVAPSEWLREVAADFQSQASGAGFALEVRVPEELPPIVADRETLATAINNLLDNAVKYSRDARTVELEARADEGGVSIFVRDHGAGIREEDRPHIFEKFYRGGGELSREVKGVGLGLNLVQHIVKAHGGTIGFDTAMGGGTTFTIHLKAARQTA